ncbi:MAG: cation:H+ antiporter [Rhodothermales bacterium]|jgi:cation:H+ antiporter
MNGWQHITPMRFATDNLLLNAIVFLAGVAALVKGSGWFIDGAADIAHHYRIPDAIVGLTLVSVGTSLPELATNVYASTQGQGGVALGNIAGSNITNVLLVLGVAILGMGTLPISKIMFRRDAVVMIISFAAFTVFCITGDELTRLEGVILLVGFVWYVYRLITSEREEVEASAEAIHAARSRAQACGMLLAGGVLVVIGAKAMVDTVVWGAIAFKVPSAVVSAVIIALGTSVPELAITVTGVIKKKNDIALGNIIGSNICNLVFVMGVTAGMSPVPVDEGARGVIYFMLGTGVLLFVFMRSSYRLVRWEGAVFILGYLAFVGYNLSLML